MRDRKSDHHRSLTEVELGRKLKTSEVVDHVNEDKADNSKTNRRVMERGEHTRMHNKARGTSKLRAALRMVKEGKRLY
jgi:hypothetical protein